MSSSIRYVRKPRIGQQSNWHIIRNVHPHQHDPHSVSTLCNKVIYSRPEWPSQFAFDPEADRCRKCVDRLTRWLAEGWVQPPTPSSTMYQGDPPIIGVEEDGYDGTEHAGDIDAEVRTEAGLALLRREWGIAGGVVGGARAQLAREIRAIEVEAANFGLGTVRSGRWQPGETNSLAPHRRLRRRDFEGAESG